MNPHLFGLDVWSWEVIPALLILLAIFAAVGVVLYFSMLILLNIVCRATDWFVKKQ